jgi:UDP-N-acetylmuramoyl-tripeptide--D-alanyl-D-alanine ligase
MTLWTTKEITEALADELKNSINNPENFTIENVFIDSRKNVFAGLFIALKGENTDGHKYLTQAFENGANFAIVEQIPEEIKNSNFSSRLILVKNTYKALNKLAEFSRKRTKAKIIALTGSVGKTGTKEMLKLAFSTQGKTFANSGNLNNHIGLPLSLSNLEADCEYAIFEMGMNHLNEIIHLSKIARPHVAIITNVGPVHIEFFKNEQEIALAKSEIFAGLEPNGVAILNADNIHFDFLKKQAELNNIKESNLITFGNKNQADYQINEITIKESSQSKIDAKIKNSQKISYLTGCSNQAVNFNSIIAVACLDLIGKDLNSGLAILKNFSSSEGRGKVSDIIVEGKKITIIDDTYNASILSMKSGLQNCEKLKNILHKKRMICALGDMLELGEKSSEIHHEVLNFVNEKHFDQIILVGKQMNQANQNIKLKNSKNFPDSISASLDFANILNDGDIVYFKGSRGMKMEKIIEKLTSKTSVH